MERFDRITWAAVVVTTYTLFWLTILVIVGGTIGVLLGLW